MKKLFLLNGPLHVWLKNGKENSEYRIQNSRKLARTSPRRAPDMSGQANTEYRGQEDFRISISNFRFDLDHNREGHKGAL